MWATCRLRGPRPAPARPTSKVDSCSALAMAGSFPPACAPDEPARDGGRRTLRCGRRGGVFGAEAGADMCGVVAEYVVDERVVVACSSEVADR